MRLLDGFVLSKSLLSAREQDEILYALQSLRATGAERDGALLTRLSALFRREAVDWIDADFSDWGDTGERRALFSLLKAAILEQRVLAFDYCGQNGQAARRTVEPAKLRFKGISWYLQAWCREKKAFRTFKLSRMEHVSLLDEQFVLHSPPPALDGAGAISVPTTRIVVRFSPVVAFRVCDEFDRATSPPAAGRLADRAGRVAGRGVGRRLSTVLWLRTRRSCIRLRCAAMLPRKRKKSRRCIEMRTGAVRYRAVQWGHQNRKDESNAAI